MIQNVAVGKRTQGIVFTTLPPMKLGDADSDPGARASSALAVSYSSSDSTVTTIVGNSIHVTGIGTAVITASQAGNDIYLPAAASQTVTVGYNTEHPTLTVSALSDGATTTETTQNISGNVYDINGFKSVTVNGTVTLLNPNGTFSYPVQLIAGANTVTVVAISNADLTTTDSRIINLDSTAPQLNISYPPDNAVAYKKAMTVTGTIAELLSSAVGKVTAKSVALGGPATVSYSINGSAPLAASQTDTTYSFTTDLGDGMNTIKVFAATVEGKKVEAKRTVSYQLPTFSLAVTDPAADARTVQDHYLLVGTVADNTTPVSITITVDDQSFTPAVQNGTFLQLLSLADDKVYQIRVSGTDQNNNSQTAQRNIIRSTPKSADGAAAPFTIIDALMALQMSAGIINPETAQTLRMDVAPMVKGISVGDGKVDVEDALVILYMAVGLI